MRVSKRTLTKYGEYGTVPNHHALCNRRTPHTILNASRIRPADGRNTVDPIEGAAPSDERILGGRQAKLNGGRFSAIGQIIKDATASARRVEARRPNRVLGLA